MSGIDPTYLTGPGIPTKPSDIRDHEPNFDPAAVGPAGKAIGAADYPAAPAIVPMPSVMTAANAWGMRPTPSTNTPPPTSVIGQGEHAPFTNKGK
jgi:hypothetical protein